MDRAAFFDAIRPAFGGKLSEAQVSGMGAILDEAARLPLHHVAHILANVRRETGGYMAPIKETVMPHHKNKNPSDAEVKRRLDVAFKAGKLPWVKAPYWLDGWFGRGQIQITHRVNYQKFGIVNPDDALKLPVSARVAVQGMVNGRFTGRKLSDYAFPAALSNPPASHPRRIVNGQDGSDAEVSRFHREFAAALEAASAPMAAPPAAHKAAQPPAPPAVEGFWARLLRAIMGIIRGK